MTSPRLNFAELIGKSLAMLVAYVLALFLGAGTFSWPSGWAYIALTSAFSFGLTVWLIRYDPALMAERLGGLGQLDQKRWDKIFISIMFVAFFGWLAGIGLDASRFHWSKIPKWLQALGLVLLLASFYFFYLTFRENTYLSPAIRIQKDRGQKVISTGPYRYVRHPMYAAFVLYVIGTALLLGSWLGVAVGLLLIAAIAWRAVQEERTLLRELPGYSEYAARVRYRLIPRIW